jgi:hypothetical protein
MNLMWIAMLFTPIRKNQINWEHQYIFTARPKVVPSVHHVIQKEQSKKQDHQVSTTEGMIDMMTVVRDMTPRRRSLRGLTPPLRPPE